MHQTPSRRALPHYPSSEAVCTPTSKRCTYGADAQCEPWPEAVYVWELMEETHIPKDKEVVSEDMTPADTMAASTDDKMDELSGEDGHEASGTTSRGYHPVGTDEIDGIRAPFLSCTWWHVRCTVGNSRHTGEGGLVLAASAGEGRRALCLCTRSPRRRFSSNGIFRAARGMWDSTLHEICV